MTLSDPQRRAKALKVACALHPEFTLPLLHVYTGLSKPELATILGHPDVAPYVRCDDKGTYRITDLEGLRAYARTLPGAS